MKALSYERNVARYAATRIMGMVASPKVALSPLRLVDIDPPKLPNDQWVSFFPRLSGICGSDVATVNSASSRYLENFVSLPFVMGHEVVGDYRDADGMIKRAVLIPSLTCEVREIRPLCPSCKAGHYQRCQMLHLGSISTGLQTGFCRDTSGGWSQELVAHRSQLFDIDVNLSDEDAVLLEPFACAVHAVFRIIGGFDGPVAVIGSGTLGLLTIAALRAINPSVEIVASAKYQHQKKLAKELGASTVCGENDLYRHARMIKGAQMISTDMPSDGFSVVFDAVGSPSSIEQALKVAAPGAEVVLVGMPGDMKVDLAPLWMKEISLSGSYAYGMENLEGKKVSTFALAAQYATSVNLARLLSATYRLDDYELAIAHADNAGKRGAVKIAFDMRKTSNKESWSQHR